MGLIKKEIREIRMQYSTECLRDRVVRICQSKTSKKGGRSRGTSSPLRKSHLYSGSNDLTESKWNRRVKLMFYNRSKRR